MLLPHTSSRAQAQKLAHTLVDLVRMNSVGTVSIGIAMIGPGQFDDALERADQAMYHAKKQGGGGFTDPERCDLAGTAALSPARCPPGGPSPVRRR